MKIFLIVCISIVVIISALLLLNNLDSSNTVEVSVPAVQAEPGPAGAFEIDMQPTGVSQSANYRLQEQQAGFADVDDLQYEE